MADIFLSYTEKDRDAVRRLAETLQSAGWSVWWDRRIPAGLTWRSVLERELQSMRCMVVLWSQRSVASEWVCEEAAEGRQLGRLVPVLIEHVRPPAGFREIQAADLVDWDGSRDFVGLRQLLEDIERLIGKPGAEGAAPSRPAPDRVEPEPALPAPPKPQPFPWAMVALLVAIGFGAYYGTLSRPPADTRIESTQAPPKGATQTLGAKPAASSADAAAAAPKEASSVSAKPSTVASASAPAGKAASASPTAGAKPASLPSSPSARCVALRERLALGETLSAASQLFFRQECSQ